LSREGDDQTNTSKPTRRKGPADRKAFIYTHITNSNKTTRES
jgi:hypothetical protein